MWQVLHDNAKTICFVGRSGLTKQCVDMLSAERDCESVTFEDLQAQNQEWINQRQFICVSGDLVFKHRVVDFLKDADFFSLIGRNNAVHPNTSIGKGTFINEYNDLLSESEIGDHVVMGCFCQLGRYVSIGNFCHISSYCYFNNCEIGEGTAVGLRSSVLGAKLSNDDAKTIAPYCNFMANSNITKSILESGTYYGNRKINSLTRLDTRLV